MNHQENLTTGIIVAVTAIMVFNVWNYGLNLEDWMGGNSCPARAKPYKDGKRRSSRSARSSAIPRTLCNGKLCVYGTCELSANETEPDRRVEECVCLLGYTGESCEIRAFSIPNCHGKLCLHGWCELSADRTDSTCRCHPGYTGIYCAEPLACFSSPCQNGGECVELGDGEYECRCTIAFMGDRCELIIQQCTPETCKNDGVCHEVYEEDDYECVCAPGWTGRQCEIADPLSGDQEDESDMMGSCPN